MLPAVDPSQVDYIDIGKTFISSRVSYARQRGRCKAKAEPKRVPFISIGSGHIDIIFYITGDVAEEIFHYLCSRESTMLERVVTRY